MPSFLANDIDNAHPVTKSIPNSNSRSHSFEKPTPAVDGLPGAWPKTPNGFPFSSSMDGSMVSLPNGKLPETGGSQEKAPSRKGSTLSTRSQRSMGTENEKRSTDLSRQAVQDGTEGYFTSAPNGRAVPSGRARSPSKATSMTAPSESMLRVPQSHHRASSPPAFSQGAPSVASSTSSAQPPLGAPPNRLIHRHTLEVPKAGRTSRDGLSQASEEGIVSASGRFSPTTPTRRRGSSQLMRRPTRSINSDMHLDELLQDEDAARWAEAIKAKRATKRKRDEVDDDRVVVGTKVDQNHVNWVTAYNMLTGIRFTVSRTNAKIDRELTEADFEARHKFSFDITGNELTPSAKYDFKFKDYAPWVFRHLRNIFGLDPADYLVSLTSKYILSELGSPGKSGSFFYFSRDYKYIIKTIHHAEHKFLRKILREYYDHVRANPNTLLSQFYGLHRVKIPYGRKIHFVVMNNLFPPHRDIHRTFDLKGSTIGRDFREEDLEKNPRATLKDLNWLRRNLHLEFGPTKKNAFIEQMEKDVALLKRLKIMDYSLLVGIHDLERGNEENLRDKTLQVFQPGGEKAEEPGPSMLMRTPSKLESARKAKELRQLIKNEKPVPMDQTLIKMPDEMQDEDRKVGYFYKDDGGFRATHEDNSPGEEIYYLGIIDCLTYYSAIKRTEHFWKGLSSPESQISAIPPERYGDRFVRFISGITKTRERAEAEKQQELPSPTSIDAHTTNVIQDIAGTLDDPKLMGINLLKTNSNLAGTDAVMARAEKAAEKSKRKGANENDVPDRSIGAVRSPDPDRSDMVLLPVIGEAAESGSARSTRTVTPNTNVTPQRSFEDGRCAFATTIGNAEMDSRVGEVPPPTPPKTDSGSTNADGLNHGLNGGDVIMERGRQRSPVPPPTPPKDDVRPPTPPKDNIVGGGSVRSAAMFGKELPPPPRASVQLSASPIRAKPEDMEELRMRIERMSA